MSQFLQFLHAKTVVCFVYSKNLKFYGKRLQQRFYSSKVKYTKMYPDMWGVVQFGTICTI